MATNKNIATQFSELQKLLINVGKGKCDAFIKTHVNAAWEGPTETGKLPEFNIEAGINDVYYNKVVFLKDYNAIYTKGTFFGYNGDLKASFEASFEDLVEGLTKGLSANGITVKYNPDATDGPAIVTSVAAATYDTDSDTWDDIDNVVTASTVQTYVDTKVASAVATATAAMNYCGTITETSFNTIKAAASNGDVYVVKGNFTINNTEKFEDGDLVIFAKEGEAAATYTVVERNLDGAVTADSNFTANQILVAAGNNKTAYTTGYKIGGNTFATTGSYIATEAGVTAKITSVIEALDNPEQTGTGTHITYTFHTTDGITYINNITPILAEYSVSTNALGETTLDNTGVDGLVDNNALNTVIGYLDGKINAVDCEVTTLTEVSDSDYFSVTEDSVDTDNDHNYKIELNVVNLGDAVGMTYDEATGKWSAPQGSQAKNGLASAADVANELVSDEKVIAAALNDHEARLDVLEAFADDINGTIQDQLVIGDVTVDGLTVTPTEEGLVNVELLARVINALDPWEDYE